MTETEKKALALVNEVRRERGFEPHLRLNRERYEDEALCRAIEQHEAFRQEVSDAVEKALYQMRANQLMQAQVAPTLTRFIIAKPDPLAEVMQDWWDTDGYANIETFRAAIEARGGRIVWVGE